MGIFRKIEELIFTGKIIREWRDVGNYNVGTLRFKYDVLLTETKKGRQIIIRSRGINFLGALGVRYFHFSRDKNSARKFVNAIQNAFNEM